VLRENRVSREIGVGAGRNERGAGRQVEFRENPGGFRDGVVLEPKGTFPACGHGGQRLRSRPAEPPANYGSGRMSAVFWLIDTIINIYIWLLIAQAILSWLLAFGVVNRWNRGVSVIWDFLYRITEPLLRPIRSFLPNFGGIDISPVILILLLMFLRRLLLYDIAPAFF
jgi:YggT family protein